MWAAWWKNFGVKMVKIQSKYCYFIARVFKQRAFFFLSGKLSAIFSQRQFNPHHLRLLLVFLLRFVLAIASMHVLYLVEHTRSYSRSLKLSNSTLRARSGDRRERWIAIGKLTIFHIYFCIFAHIPFVHVILYTRMSVAFQKKKSVLSWDLRGF